MCVLSAAPAIGSVGEFLVSEITPLYYVARSGSFRRGKLPDRNFKEVHQPSTTRTAAAGGEFSGAESVRLSFEKVSAARSIRKPKHGTARWINPLFYREMLAWWVIQPRTAIGIWYRLGIVCEFWA